MASICILKMGEISCNITTFTMSMCSFAAAWIKFQRHTERVEYIQFVFVRMPMLMLMPMASDLHLKKMQSAKLGQFGSTRLQQIKFMS